MRKILLFGVVLLLIFSLPTVSMATGWEERETEYTVTFAGPITGTGTCIIYEHKKIIIEFRPIELTFDASITGFDGTYSGWFYLKIWKGETKVEYRFGEITEGKYVGYPSHALVGSGTWDDGTKTITCAGEFTIYGLTWKGWGSVKAYDQQWSGSLTFTIVMVPV